MINDVVKRFIEDNIEVIEQNKWFMLFMDWYTNSNKEFPDSLQFRELMDILSTIDKEIYPHTKTYRKSVLVTVTRGTIAEIRKTLDIWTRNDKVSLKFMLMNLYSTLGLSKDEVIDCIMDAAESEGLTFDATKKEFSGLKI